MARASAGLVMYRMRDGQLEVLLVHPGGPFWARKDQWVIPKGELLPAEEPLAAAKREFQEETGLVPQGPLTPLGNVKQKSGKTVSAWAFEGDCDPRSVTSNTFELEWPPKSGKFQSFPEIDRAEFFTIQQAKLKMIQAEFELIERLAKHRNSNQ